MNKNPPNIEQLHELHTQGKLDQAKTGYLAIIQKHPNQVEALHALGMISVEEGNLEEATDYFKKAMGFQKHNPRLPLHLSNVLKMQGLFSQATQLLMETIIQFPDYPPAYNNLGTLYYAQGKLTEAIRYYRIALEKEPQYIDAYYNLGLALIKSDKLEAALEAFQKLLGLAPQHSAACYQLASITMRQEKWAEATQLFLELALIHPQHVETLVNLATCYFKQRKLKEAKHYYLQALAENPQDRQVLFNLAVICTEQGEIGETVQHYQELLRQNPDDYDAHHNLGTLYFAKKQMDLAAHHFQQALRIQPDHPPLEHLLKIIHGDQNLLASPPSYLKSLFDYYADHYEPHLLNTLDYQVPQILHKAFLSLHKYNDSKLDILDLGCGTGLCGEVFKFNAASLVGIDLSSKMLAVAAEKKIYDKLICKDLITYLNTQNACFDLILAGDVLVYVGDLSEVFKGIRQALRHQGLFIFNTEISKDQEYHINPYGRFAHHQNYIEKLCENNNLSVIYQQTAITRLQNNQPESGCIFILQFL